MFRFLLKILGLLLVLLCLVLILFRLWAVVRESKTIEKALAPHSHWAAAGSFDDKYIETESTRFFTLRSGPTTNPTVLLAHGTAAWSGFWKKEVEALGGAGYHAIAFDMPPFGFSSRAADGDYSRQAQASRILELARALPEVPIMVAHSFGAAAATEAALRNPEAFAGLIIIDGAIGMGTTPSADLPLPLRPRWLRETALSATATNPAATRFFLRQLIHQKDAASDTYIEVLQLPQKRTGTTKAYGDWLPSLLAPDPTSLSLDPANYADLPIPVRIIWGDMDTVTPPDQAEALATALAQEGVHYLKDVGHIPHIEAPAAFNKLLLELLADIAQAR